MKIVFETAECEEVENSILLMPRYEKHENRMKGCGVELNVSDWQMSVRTVKGRRGVADDPRVML